MSPCHQLHNGVLGGGMVKDLFFLSSAKSIVNVFVDFIFNHTFQTLCYNTVIVLWSYTDVLHCRSAGMVPSRGVLPRVSCFPLPYIW